MFQLLVCDDHPSIRTALRFMARDAAISSDVTETANTRELLDALQSRKNFDLLIMDLNLPGLSGLAVLTQIRAMRPELPIVVLSADEDPEVVQRALDAGANRYFFKSVDDSVLFQALREAAGAAESGRAAPFGAGEGARLADGLSMTARQRDVLGCLLNGMSAKEIARTLNLSEGTVKSHTVAVFRSLNVKSRAQAIVEAHRRGLHRAP